ncbi:Actin- protein 2/3 complex subunit 5 [Trebouxia sp. C0010 RCD-2024]
MSAQTLKETLAAMQYKSSKSPLSQAETLGPLVTCLKSTTDTDIPGILRQLTDTEADHLLQLIYLGLAQAQAPLSNLMFRWHEQVTSAFGLGAIVRTFTC